MTTFSISALCDQVKALGRAALFYSDWWDETGDLTLTYLGDTEGEVTVEGTEVMSMLTAPEQSGEVPLEVHVTNPALEVSLPLYVADPDLLDVLSPVGSRHMGNDRQVEATYYTLALIPERLLVQSGQRQDLVYESAGSWTLGGVALTAAKVAILDQAFSRLRFWMMILESGPQRLRVFLLWEIQIS